MAKLDPLTKMPNRTLFSERPEQATAHNGKGGKRLQTCVSEQGAVAHVGGDEFSVILDDIYNEEEILAVAGNMLIALSDAFQVDCKEILHQIALTSSHIR